jgi:hypothetical protein
MALRKKQQRSCRELWNNDGMKAALGNQTLIFHKRNKTAKEEIEHGWSRRFK